ncbi:class I SAM-dependent methyltransferase [Dyadobacter sp. 676]|uniref:Class I SAM-dependent methyltransferase n=1 Tax=Dyadobacter sp. 676 TaxID=3088362 RepID=A0AAU8FGJ1_9BACT
MKTKLSARLLAAVDALPLEEGFRVLEIGCGPGAAAREVARRVGQGYVLAIDRSANAIRQATKSSAAGIGPATLSFRRVAIEDFELAGDEAPFDLAFATRVGALDGRHPEIEDKALARIRQALKPGGKLYVDGQLRFTKSS